MNYARRYPRFWLWYFVASAAMAAVSAGFALVASFGANSIQSVVGVALGFAGLVPLYGYVRQRRIEPRWLWLAIYYLTLIGTLLVAVAVLHVSWSRSTVTPLLYTALPFSLGVPWLLAVYLYVYRSPDIWRTTGDDKSSSAS
jgi:uncharacterized membrane protein